MKKVIAFTIGVSLLSITCSELSTVEEPVKISGIITDSTHLPADSSQTPVDTSQSPIDSVGVPIDTVVVKEPYVNSDSIYHVVSTDRPLPIDGVWDKPEWSEVEANEITHFSWIDPDFRPLTHVKMCYDQDYVYVIFQVQDQYVRALATEINGEVWEDAAVEFFFAPDTAKPMIYFNLEINCIGTPLMFYIQKPMTDYIMLPEADIRKIKIASSLQGPIEEEIADPITWTIEYKIPLAMIDFYANVTMPAPGVTWKANFFKIATNNSNEHFVTWSPVISENPNFHQPQYFGCLKFVE